VATDLSVKATYKSIGRNVFGRLGKKQNFLLVQQILFFGVKNGITTPSRLISTQELVVVIEKMT
jgi:hypothetical protein